MISDSVEAHRWQDADRVVAHAIARAIAPRKPLTVSQWADANRKVTSKEGSKTGDWQTSTNPPLREPMDCLSRGSAIREVVLLFMIQYGKTQVALNAIGYTMDHDPGPMIVFLPDELSMGPWISQKLNPMLESTPACQRALTSTASRESANQKAFKDFAGGQLYIEHGKTASRLAMKSARIVLVDELDKLAAALPGGEDPLELMRGRVTNFQNTYKILFAGTPGVKGVSRLDGLYEKSDQRRYYVPCPHCGHEQPLQWKAMQWTPDRSKCWYVCREGGCVIEEYHKTEMIARGRWVAENPGAKTRGYHLNALYYSFGMGPRWLDLVEQFCEAANDPAKLQVFVQERLAESWEDPHRRNVRDNVLADRAEPYKLRVCPRGVLEVTAGVDTQDNRLAVQIIGWGRGMASWTIDYLELPGDPDEFDPRQANNPNYLAKVWLDLADLLNRPIEHELGGLIRVAATAIDIGGHKTEAVKHFVRRALIRRPMAIFGAVQNNAVPLGKPKLADISRRGQVDKRGVQIWQVGTVHIKDQLFGRMSKDAERDRDHRLVHFSEQLGNPDNNTPHFFAGMVSEVYNPAKNRYDKKRGARNEPLDTWVYAYAAANHPELRLHRRSNAEWDAAEQRIKNGQASTPAGAPAAGPPTPQSTKSINVPRETEESSGDGFGSKGWSDRW